MAAGRKAAAAPTAPGGTGRARRPGAREPLAPGEAYVFKLGPLEAAEGTTSFYVAARAGAHQPAASMATHDAEGLQALAQQLGTGGRRYCEPRLARAGAPLGFISRALPKALLPVRALMALGTALGTESWQVPADLLRDLLDASRAPWKAAPWLFWSNVESLTLSVSSDTKPREVCLLGNGGEEFGFALYEAPGTVARFTEAVEEGDADAPLRPQSLALTFHDDPAWVRSAVRQATALPLYPLPLRAGQGDVQPLRPGDALLLVTVARALAALTPMHRKARGEARDGGQHLVAEVVAPLPLFTGLLVGSFASPFTVGWVRPAPLPPVLPVRVPAGKRPRLPTRKVSETLLDFASPLVEARGATLLPEELQEVLALAITAWNAVVLDAWEPGSDWVEQARRAIHALPGSMRSGVERDFELLVERKRTRFADDPRLLSGLELVPRGPCDVGVRLEGRLTPATHEVYGG